MTYEYGLVRKYATKVAYMRMNPSHEIAGAFKRHEIPFFDDEKKLIDYVGKEAQPFPTFAAKFAAAKVEPSLFDAS